MMAMLWIKRLARSVIIIVPTYIAFTDSFYSVRVVDGVSMKPTLNPSGFNTDYVLLNRWGMSRHEFERGEIVSLVSPKNPNQWLIKRVIALEGDEVKCRSCFEEKVSIPKGHCWVEGDNLDCSMDSNNFGPVPTGLITAQALSVIWPPSRWGKLEKRETVGDRLTDRSAVERGHMFFGWDVE